MQRTFRSFFIPPWGLKPNRTCSDFKGWSSESSFASSLCCAPTARPGGRIIWQNTRERHDRRSQGAIERGLSSRGHMARCSALRARSLTSTSVRPNRGEQSFENFQPLGRAVRILKLAVETAPG
jgi:hypothetical protein